MSSSWKLLLALAALAAVSAAALCRRSAERPIHPAATPDVSSSHGVSCTQWDDGRKHWLQCCWRAKCGCRFHRRGDAPGRWFSDRCPS